MSNYLYEFVCFFSITPFFRGIVRDSEHLSPSLRCPPRELFLSSRGWVPPFYPSALSAEPDACRRFDLTDPVPEKGCMVDDERGAVFREDIFKKAVEKYISIRVLHRLAVIPGCGANKTMICSLIPPIEHMVSISFL